MFARQTERWNATLLAPEGNVEAGSAVTVRAELRRTAPHGPPEPGEEVYDLTLNGEPIARETRDEVFEGETVRLVASGLSPHNSPLAFGENVVAFESSEFSGPIEAGRFRLLQRAAVVKSLTFNKDAVKPGEFFKATVVHEGTTDSTTHRRLAIVSVERDADGSIIDATTLYSAQVDTEPGTNETEVALKMTQMDSTEELCAFLEVEDPQGPVT